MARTTVYEWDAEEYYLVDCQDVGQDIEAGEVRDHNFSHSAAGALQHMRGGTGLSFTAYRLVLVRSRWDEGNKLSESWACVEDEQLPAHFLDAFDEQEAAVPVRFVRELASAMATRAQ